jgi:multicomponent Na+:H+ antiporter subunit D
MWIVLPLLIPLAMGIGALIRFRDIRRAVVMAGTFLNMVVCLALLAGAQGGNVMVSQMGGHPAPYGIAIVVDTLSAVMLAVTGVIAFGAALFSRATIDVNRERFAYYPLFAFLLMGINFAFLTGDLFTLYVAFEVMLMASFVLLTLGGERGQLEGGLKYVTLNLISSTIFLMAVGLTYAVAGTLNLADLSQRLAGLESPGITTLLAGLFFLAFGIKAAIFPLFFWLPASYHTPPIAVTAMFGGVLTKVGIYSMWRVLGMIFPQDLAYLQPLILTIAGLTMITGVLGALAQMEARRLLSFHIISQIGYLVMGMGLMTYVGLSGAVFFMAHVILAKTILFFISGITHQVQGSYELKKLGGFQKSHPLVALLFLVGALSLAGVPPLPGFWAKLTLIRAGLEAGQYGIVAVALGVSLLTLYSMTKIWHEVFWKAAPASEYAAGEAAPPSPVERAEGASSGTSGGMGAPFGERSGEFRKPRETDHMRWLMAPTVMLAAFILLIGIFAEPVYQISQRAARGVLEPAAYVQTVLFPGE